MVSYSVDLLNPIFLFCIEKLTTISMCRIQFSSIKSQRKLSKNCTSRSMVILSSMYVLWLINLYTANRIVNFQDLLIATRTSYLYTCNRRKIVALARKLSKPSPSWKTHLVVANRKQSVTKRNSSFKLSIIKDHSVTILVT